MICIVSHFIHSENNLCMHPTKSVHRPFLSLLFHFFHSHLYSSFSSVDSFNCEASKNDLYEKVNQNKSVDDNRAKKEFDNLLSRECIRGTGLYSTQISLFFWGGGVFK